MIRTKTIGGQLWIEQGSLVRWLLETTASLAERNDVADGEPNPALDMMRLLAKQFSEIGKEGTIYWHSTPALQNETAPRRWWRR